MIPSVFIIWDTEDCWKLPAIYGNNRRINTMKDCIQLINLKTFPSQLKGDGSSCEQFQSYLGLAICEPYCHTSPFDLLHNRDFTAVLDKWCSANCSWCWFWWPKALPWCFGWSSQSYPTAINMVKSKSCALLVLSCKRYVAWWICWESIMSNNKLYLSKKTPVKHYIKANG